MEDHVIVRRASRPDQAIPLTQLAQLSGVDASIAAAVEDADSAVASSLAATYATVNDVYRTGTGFPEGVTTAPVGSRYIDTAATNGAIEWIKASGTGSTGWKVVYGDTGVRNLTSLLLNGCTVLDGGHPSVIRIGRTVHFTANASQPSGWVSGTPMIVVPTGFRPIASTAVYLPDGYSNATAFFLEVNGDLKVFGGANGRRASWVWLTDDAWPTTLPGT